MENCAAEKLLASKENVGQDFYGTVNSCLSAMGWFQCLHSSGYREFSVLLPCVPPPVEKGLDPPALPSQRVSSSSKSNEISSFCVTAPQAHVDMEYLDPAGPGVTTVGWRCLPASALSFPLEKPQMQSWESFPHASPSASVPLASQSANLDNSHCPQIPHKPRDPGKCFPAKMLLQKWLSWNFLYTSKSRPGTVLIATSRIN